MADVDDAARWVAGGKAHRRYRDGGAPYYARRHLRGCRYLNRGPTPRLASAGEMTRLYACEICAATEAAELSRKEAT